ncbi:hypothetical protein [Nodosilinea sp. FACHB-13]|uniref:hypothetical protein n=1 Tax=Cyanophyceae TaxID=3028117 RepID=UPI00168306DF|nr:hypothetical protein [Nodosilinea sp. FACHB-13]MBD2107413.1 hypothetical protein [Nodosilinea sp. FACHB-13]
MTTRDRFTTASAAPENATANYRDLHAVDEVGEKIYRENRDSGRLTAHMQAIRLISSVQ